MEQITKTAPKGFKKSIRENYKGWLFASPAILGALIFMLVPIILSLVYSFFDYNVISPMRNFGFQNYVRAFTADSEKFYKSVTITMLFTAINIPFSLILSFALALLLNRKAKGIGAFRVICYLPCVIPGIATALIWRNFTDTTYGLGLSAAAALGLPAPTFFNDPNTAMATFFFVNSFGLGGDMVLWLAQLKAVPPQLYEAGRIDGASSGRMLFRITIPLCTPMIFYKLVLCVIGSLQSYTASFMLLDGGAGKGESMLFYGFKIYQEAFGREIPRMGYASALAWMLFAAVSVMTALLFKTNRWTYYGEDA
jgi:multiple sugar transport system permease protein